MRYFNPFLEIFETSDYPHARTLRTGFFSKFDDAFNVICGRQSMYENYLYWSQDPSMKRRATFGTESDYREYIDYQGEYHVGIYDYLTLMIPKAIDLIFAYSIKKVDELPKWQAVLLTLPLIPLILPVVINTLVRPLVSCMLTIVSLPIIASVQIVSAWLASPKKSQIEQLQFTNGQKLKDFMEAERCSYETINLKLNTAPAEICVKSRYSQQPKRISLEQANGVTLLNKPVVKALFELNISNINKSYKLPDETVSRNTENTISPRLD